MTAETAFQNILLECGIEDASLNVTGTTYEVRQFRRAMDETGQELVRRGEWEELLTSWDIAAGVSAIDVPADFHRLSEASAVRTKASGHNPTRVVTSAQTWAFLSASGTSQPYCHLSGGQLQFSPATPAEGVQVVYVSKHWAGASETITGGGDVFRVPEPLIEAGAAWRWLRQKGLPYEDKMNEYEAMILAEFKADRSVKS